MHQRNSRRLSGVFFAAMATLALTACGNDVTEPPVTTTSVAPATTSASASPTPALPAPAPAATTDPVTVPQPEQPAVVDPPPADVDERCTNQIDYAGDPRSNAEINSIGEATGQCPAPQTG